MSKLAAVKSKMVHDIFHSVLPLMAGNHNAAVYGLPIHITARVAMV